MKENGLRGQDLKGRSERGNPRRNYAFMHHGTFVEVRSYRYASPLGFGPGKVRVLHYLMSVLIIIAWTLVCDDESRDGGNRKARWRVGEFVCL